MTNASPVPIEAGPTVAGLLRCLDCGAAIGGQERCPGCGRAYPGRGGIVEAIGPLAGRNRITEAFYGGPAWDRFRRWERLFLALQGGNRRARTPILRHLPAGGSVRLLEVGIGDGDNLPFLPGGWEVIGIDHTRARLEGCLRRFPGMAGRLARAEAEALPFPGESFDACLCVGGFTTFEGHAEAIREMRRVTRPEGPVVVADEVPGLVRAGIGHLIGVPRLDMHWLRLLGLEREFIEMVFDLPGDLDAIVAAALPGSARHRIWGGLGYCFVHR